MSEENLIRVYLFHAFAKQQTVLLPEYQTHLGWIKAAHILKQGKGLTISKIKSQSKQGEIQTVETFR